EQRRGSKTAVPACTRTVRPLLARSLHPIFESVQCARGGLLPGWARQRHGHLASPRPLFGKDLMMATQTKETTCPRKDVTGRQEECKKAGETEERDIVDGTSEDSFPASD